jgi:Tol biopolymer transport system component
MPDSDSDNAVQVPNSGDVLFVNWTPAGSFVYTSRASDIWTMNSDGTNQMQLTNDQGRNIHATMTADGRYIVFHSNREDGTNHIFRMDADGRNQVQLTNGRGESGGRLSPDGKWVYFASSNGVNEPSSICRVSIEGGEPMYIAQVASESPTFDISPRTGLIAYRQSGKGQEKNGGNISIIPPEGGQPLKILTLPPTAAGMFRWTPDERAIAFQDTRNGGTNIWALSRDKGEARPLTDFKTENISFSFAWSVDGKKLAVIRSTRVTDAVLVTEIK